jgi:diguanylate cyclase (GGDEF)-like protein
MMKSVAAYSGLLENPSTPEGANYGRRVWALISKRMRGGHEGARAATADKTTAELATVRAQLAAMQRANLQLKQRLAAAASAVELAELAALAYTDCLTGLANRRALLIAAGREIARMQRTGRPACVVLVDIDHFKAVNDGFGHAAGDAVLKLTAETLAAHTRSTDTVARWGGEEFVLLLPETDLAAAQIVAEKCRIAIQAQKSVSAQGQCAVTITLGVSLICPGDTPEAAIARADAALYQGKAGGRNRVVA